LDSFDIIKKSNAPMGVVVEKRFRKKHKKESKSDWIIAFYPSPGIIQKGSHNGITEKK
jgi:hypothetical protein